MYEEIYPALYRCDLRRGECRSWTALSLLALALFRGGLAKLLLGESRHRHVEVCEHG